MTTKKKVLICDPMDKEALKPLLEDELFDVDYREGRELKEIIPKYHAIIIRS